MILTHPFLFNTIVVLFIAFTSGWMVFAINSKTMTELKRKLSELENEKEAACKQVQTLEERLEDYSYPLNSTRIINFTSAKANNGH